MRQQYYFTYKMKIKLQPNQQSMSWPGIKGDSIQEGAVIVVPNVISDHGPASAWLRHHLVLNSDVILRVVDVHQQDVEHQSRLRGNLVTWQTEKWRILDVTSTSCNMQVVGYKEEFHFYSSLIYSKLQRIKRFVIHHKKRLTSGFTEYFAASLSIKITLPTSALMLPSQLFDLFCL